MENHYLAIDVGGTKVKYGLVNHSGELVERGNQPTNRRDLKTFVAQLQAIIALYHDDIRGVGISLPVRVNHDTGTIHTGVMWSFLDGVDLKTALQLDLPLAIENDGKAAALAELWVGELKGVANGLALVLGTGVGGADLRRKAAGAELAAQLGNVIAQVLGKGILRAAHVAFPAGVGHAAARHILGGKRQRLAAALHQQHGHAAGEGFHQLGTGGDGGLLCG